MFECPIIHVLKRWQTIFERALLKNMYDYTLPKKLTSFLMNMATNERHLRHFYFQKSQNKE